MPRSDGKGSHGRAVISTTIVHRYSINGKAGQGIGKVAVTSDSLEFYRLNQLLFLFLVGPFLGLFTPIRKLITNIRIGSFPLANIAAVENTSPQSHESMKIHCSDGQTCELRLSWMGKAHLFDKIKAAIDTALEQGVGRRLVQVGPSVNVWKPQPIGARAPRELPEMAGAVAQPAPLPAAGRAPALNRRGSSAVPLQPAETRQQTVADGLAPPSTLRAYAVAFVMAWGILLFLGLAVVGFLRLKPQALSLPVILVVAQLICWCQIYRGKQLAAFVLRILAIAFFGPLLLLLIFVIVDDTLRIGRLCDAEAIGSLLLLAAMFGLSIHPLFFLARRWKLASRQGALLPPQSPTDERSFVQQLASLFGIGRFIPIVLLILAAGLLLLGPWLPWASSDFGQWNGLGIGRGVQIAAYDADGRMIGGGPVDLGSKVPVASWPGYVMLLLGIVIGALAYPPFCRFRRAAVLVGVLAGAVLVQQFSAMAAWKPSLPTQSLAAIGGDWHLDVGLGARLALMGAVLALLVGLATSSESHGTVPSCASAKGANVNVWKPQPIGAGAIREPHDMPAAAAISPRVVQDRKPRLTPAILAALIAGVFVVIGGIAVALHVATRLTSPKESVPATAPQQQPVSIALTKAEFKKRLLATAHPGYLGDPATLKDAALFERGVLDLVGKPEMQARAKEDRPGQFVILFQCSDGQLEMEFFPFAINDAKVMGIVDIRER